MRLHFQKFLNFLVRCYPLARKFPLPFALLLMIIGGIFGSVMLMSAASSIVVYLLWGYAYEVQARQKSDGQ